MTLTFNLSDEAEKALRSAFGSRIDRAAQEALAVEAYRRGALSLGQFAQMLGLSQYGADGLLKERGVELDISADEVVAEADALLKARPR